MLAEAGNVELTGLATFTFAAEAARAIVGKACRSVCRLVAEAA